MRREHTHIISNSDSFHLDIPNEEMISWAFGQGSNTAKKIYAGRPFPVPAEEVSTVNESMLDEPVRAEPIVKSTPPTFHQDVPDEEMINWAFAQGSNTAKKIYSGRSFPLPPVRTQPEDFDEFDEIVKSYPVDWVMVTGSFNEKNPRENYSLRVFFKNDLHGCVDSPVDIDISAEYIIKNLAMQIDREKFDFFQKAFPGLIDDNLVQAKTEWDKKRKEEYKAAFVAKMEEKIPRSSISKVVLGNSCYQTYPCQHDVSFYQLGDNEHPKFTEEFSSALIAEHYAEFLSPQNFMHIREYMDDEEAKERLTAKNITQTLTEDVEYAHVHLSTFYTYSSQGFKPEVEVRGLSISYEDGKSKFLKVTEPMEIIRYFGKYLDEESINMISPPLAPEILAIRAERIANLPNSDALNDAPPQKQKYIKNDFHTGYRGRFFSSLQGTSKVPDLASDVTDEKMAKSAFGQTSNTAKRL